MTPPVALTIAGSDSGGGAGIQADLKSFAALGVFGTSAITAVTSQNTVAVTRVDVLDPAAVDAQIDAVLADLPVAAVKTGMLATAEIVELVARRAAAGDLPHLVVDPVMVASSGDRLLDEDAESAYRELLFPHAEVITPNLLEAARPRSAARWSTADARGRAAAELAAETRRLGRGEGRPPRAGRPPTPSPTATRPRRAGQRARRHRATSTAPAARSPRPPPPAWPQGLDPLAALRQAKAFVDRGVRGGADWRLGGGHGPIDHFGWEAS